MAKKNLNLNSLSRYSKQSPRLVLEEHGHCEVPAGCGGVVLRWINPHEELPIIMNLHRNGELEVYLDGSPLSSARPLVKYGQHTLAFRATGFNTDYGLLMFVAIYSERDSYVGVIPPDNAHPLIVSVPDGTWKYLLTEPPDDSWMHNGYDDSKWMQMVERHLPLLSEEHDQRLFAEWKAFGATELGIQGKGSVGEIVCVRKEFCLSTQDMGR
jgi:hypothetical protein